MKEILKIFFSSVLAGMLVAMGGFVYLSCVTKFNNAIVGAMLFSIGLFVIVVYKLNLFTGKVCYMLFEDRKYNLNLLIILLGNLVGAALIGYILRITASDALLNVVEGITTAKNNQGLLNSFILANFCGVMIFLAVDIYKNAESPLCKCLGLVLGITVFILCGFEHCIANAFYFSIANAWSWQTILNLLIMIIGNTTGGALFAYAIQIFKK